MKRTIYLDYNATTPLHPEVKKTIKDTFDIFGNPSSLHSFGRDAKAKVEESRDRVASFIGAKSEEIIFTGSGSEANNTIFNMFACTSGVCGSHKKMCSRKIITTAIEHPCVLEASWCLISRGMEVSYLKVDEYGKIDLEDLKRALTNVTGLVSVMMANNEIGTIQDIKQIAKIVHESGALFHTDAVQAVGKIPVNVDDLGVDFLTYSAHKIYGPKGVGALYVRKNTPFCPFIRGGHQERGRRAGTENTLGIIGFGKAVELRKSEMADEEKRLLKLKGKLHSEIEKNISDIHFNGHPKDCLPGTLNVSFDGTEGEAILLYLDMEGIAVSTGSACASGSLDPSHVLLAIGLQAELAHSSIRISLGRDTNEEDIDYTVLKLTEVIKKVRSISTAYNKK